MITFLPNTLVYESYTFANEQNALEFLTSTGHSADEIGAFLKHDVEECYLGDWPMSFSDMYDKFMMKTKATPAFGLYPTRHEPFAFYKPPSILMSTLDDWGLYHSFDFTEATEDEDMSLSNIDRLKYMAERGHNIVLLSDFHDVDELAEDLTEIYEIIEEDKRGNSIVRFMIDVMSKYRHHVVYADLRNGGVATTE